MADLSHRVDFFDGARISRAGSVTSGSGELRK
jgi:hypothetical protein